MQLIWTNKILEKRSKMLIKGYLIPISLLKLMNSIDKKKKKKLWWENDRSIEKSLATKKKVENALDFRENS